MRFSLLNNLGNSTVMKDYFDEDYEFWIAASIAVMELYTKETNFSLDLIK
jgi:hypothetical protein